MTINLRWYKPRTFAFYCGIRLITFGVELEALGYRIQNIFVIGQHLSSAFRNIARHIIEAGQFIRDTDDDIRVAINVVMAILYGWGLVDLLYWISDNYRQIRENPRQFIVNLLSQYGWWIPIILNNPRYFVEYFLRQVHWTLPLLITNPLLLFITLLSQSFPLIYSFFINPRDFIINKLKEVFPDIWLFLVNPRQFVALKLIEFLPDIMYFLLSPQQYIFNKLRLVNPDLSIFLVSPVEYIKNKLILLLKLHPAFWSNPDYYLIIKIIEIFDRYLDSVKLLLSELFIKFILKYI